MHIMIDLGVWYVKRRWLFFRVRGEQLIRVKEWPAKGQYSFSDQSGDYVFSGADAGCELEVVMNSLQDLKVIAA